MPKQLFPAAIVALVLTGAGCSTVASRMNERAAAVAALPPDVRGKVERGEVEVGFTPELVYIALGRPLSPAGVKVDATREGTWEYRGFPANDRDYIQGGFRYRTVYDPVRRQDVKTIEPASPRLLPNLAIPTLTVTFRAGRVVEVRRGVL